MSPGFTIGQIKEPWHSPRVQTLIWEWRVPTSPGSHRVHIYTNISMNEQHMAGSIAELNI